MKVGVDISQLAYSGGVVNYTKQLAEKLASREDLAIEFFYGSFGKSYSGNLPHVHSFPLPQVLTQLLFNDWRVVPIETFIGNIDVFHSSDWVQPKTSAKKVTTYHDVVPIKFPQWSHPQIVKVHQKRLQIIEEEIDHVIAVSLSTKQDLLELSKIPESKITVIYEGVDEIFKPQSEKEVADLKKEYNLPDKFILGIGGIGDRRNLIRARQACADYTFIVTGVDIPYIPYQKLPVLYQAASLLLYPSLYEGFGLPILEAMAVGCPVVTSNISSMPEVAGQAAVLVDPHNTGSIAKGIIEALGSAPTLKIRGFEQAKKFSWQKNAEQTVKIYQSLLKND